MKTGFTSSGQFVKTEISQIRLEVDILFLISKPAKKIWVIEKYAMSYRFLEAGLLISITVNNYSDLHKYGKIWLSKSKS